MKTFKSFIAAFSLLSVSLFAHPGHTSVPHVHSEGATINLLLFSMIIIALVGIGLVTRRKLSTK